MPTPCIMIGTLVAGMPICCAAKTTGSATTISPAIENVLLRIATSLLCSRARLFSWCGRFLARQNVVQIVVRWQAFGGQQIDGTVDWHAHRARVLVHPGVAVQN